jgi:hypothetical protein
LCDFLLVAEKLRKFVITDSHVIFLITLQTKSMPMSLRTESRLMPKTRTFK